MTALLPTRVSIYDFLIQDTKPIAPIIADMGNVSIPQARILIESGIQAIVSALLAYHQSYGSEAVLKKLFNRSQVKELRKHNAFNLKTMSTAIQYGQAVNDVLFPDVVTQKAVCQHLASLSDLQGRTVKPILASLTLICIRELAVLADFAQLDANEIDTWLNQQPQFLALPRQKTDNTHSNGNTITPIYSALSVPQFESDWHEITGFTPPKVTTKDKTDNIPHYAKVIGRTTQSHTVSNENDANTNQSPLSEASVPSHALAVIDKQNNSDILTFSSMTGIHLPYQRWLLQLAKISDIYLSRNRLRIAPEPKQPPSRPLVSFGFMEEKTASTASEQPIVYDKPDAFWKNPVLLIILAIIGGLSLLAIGKYQYKKYTHDENQSLPSLSETSTPDDDTRPKDIAIIQISETE